MATYDGRLELTWTNKDLRLLAHEDGSYEWLSPSDYRVAEVRLLHDTAMIGTAGKTRAADSLLIRGDALNALTSLSGLPEFAAQYLGKVKLAYIDPPFNTQQSFLDYDDALEHSVWLTMLRDRLHQIKALLRRDGTVWLHLDDSEMHRARCVLDEVFGPENFVATIIWQKSYTRENRKDISTQHDYIIVYAVDTNEWKRTRNLLPSSEAQKARYSNPDSDPRGPWKATPMHAQGGHGTEAQFYALTTPAIVQIASNPGDIVLDCFLGSGTTAAVAQKMGRKWVAVERETETVENFALPRLQKVVAGEDSGGVTNLASWSGGGGFRVLNVAPSMYDADDGLVFLADWMTNGALAEATAAQLGFEYEESPPFAGRKGRTRLAVVDGVVNESVVRILASALDEAERVVVCGTGIDTDARPILRELRPGSTLRKIPSALLDEYRSARQLSLVPAVKTALAPSENGAAWAAEIKAEA